MRTKKSAHPRVAVLFEVIPKKESKEEYLRLGAELKAELVKIPGFISVERFASLNEEGKLLSLSFGKTKKLRRSGVIRYIIVPVRKKDTIFCLRNIKFP